MASGPYRAPAVPRDRAAAVGCSGDARRGAVRRAGAVAARGRPVVGGGSALRARGRAGVPLLVRGDRRPSRAVGPADQGHRPVGHHGGLATSSAAAARTRVLRRRPLPGGGGPLPRRGTGAVRSRRGDRGAARTGALGTAAEQPDRAVRAAHGLGRDRRGRRVPARGRHLPGRRRPRRPRAAGADFAGLDVTAEGRSYLVDELGINALELLPRRTVRTCARGATGRRTSRRRTWSWASPSTPRTRRRTGTCARWSRPSTGTVCGSSSTRSSPSRETTPTWRWRPTTSSSWIPPRRPVRPRPVRLPRWRAQRVRQQPVPVRDLPRRLRPRHRDPAATLAGLGPPALGARALDAGLRHRRHPDGQHRERLQLGLRRRLPRPRTLPVPGAVRCSCRGPGGRGPLPRGGGGADGAPRAPGPAPPRRLVARGVQALRARRRPRTGHGRPRLRRDRAQAPCAG